MKGQYDKEVEFLRGIEYLRDFFFFFFCNHSRAMREEAKWAAGSEALIFNQCAFKRNYSLCYSKDL